jgi:hypothetical protein
MGRIKTPWLIFFKTHSLPAFIEYMLSMVQALAYGFLSFNRQKQGFFAWLTTATLKLFSTTWALYK